ncbi:MAG: hypothetical protein EU531_00220 [Promethearchaeota archaeon]|nr:MAG: hypothetical protein EU531_00220 [Candidatus Lokiarchaeota archaeon]
MAQKHLYCRFGLIGENLELKQNVNLYFDEEGIITDFKFEEIDTDITLDRMQENYLVIPGLINSHTHIGDSFAKEKGHNKELIEVVSPPNGIKHQLLRETAESEKIKGIKSAIQEMISNGITYFMDFRENGVKGIESLQKALRNESIRCLIFGRFNQLDEVKKVFNKSDGIGLSSYHQLSEELKTELRTMKSFSSKKLACHVAELNHEDFLFKQIMDDALVDIMIHGTQLESNELRKIKQNNIKLVLCPRSNGYFGLGYPPVKDLLELSIPISLGTDNVMVNNLNLFEEMRYLYYIAKNQIRDDKSIKIIAKNIFKMVTINAAKNFYIESKVGSISLGKLADLVIINLNDPNYYFNNLDRDGFFSLLLHRTNGRNIKRVYIGGKCIYEGK